MREGIAPGHALEHFRRENLPELPWFAQSAAGASERQRIAIVGPSGTSLAGTFGALIHEIREHGHEVICLAPGLDGPSGKVFSRMGVQCLSLRPLRRGLSPFSDQRNLLQLVSLLRKIDPDIAAGYSPKGAVLTAMAAKMAGVGHIVSLLAELGRGFTDNPNTYSRAVHRLHKEMYRLTFRLSDTAVFLNEENHKVLLRHNVLPATLRQFPFNGGGVDLSMCPYTDLPPLDRGVMFLFAGPLDRRLGVQDFCEAARLLRTKNGNFRCLLAGPEVRGKYGFPLSELKRYREVVQYIGPQVDPRPLMARTHVFVLPATGDAVPNALIEAVAMGRPVITTTSRGCRVAVSEGTNGVLVPPGDPAALASGMARLLVRPDLIPSMSRASRALAESRFDSRRIHEQLLNALGL
jgi:glycosyltransferase involved in cell wall biosynthesis